jgi:3-hydroxyacyl-[acyl-carrier-protein] dehydratase
VRFLLVDRVASVEGDRRIVGFKNVALSEDYLEWHFPEQPIVPGMLVLEAFAQLAGWLEAKASSFERWVLLDRVVSARYYGFAVPGDRIELRLERVDAPDLPADRRAYRGESLVDGARRATVEFEASVVPLDGLDSRERAERAFQVLLATPLAPAKGGPRRPKA